MKRGNEKGLSGGTVRRRDGKGFDSCTTIDELTFALINVNTASKEVLMVFTGMEESDAEAIISAREGLLLIAQYSCVAFKPGCLSLESFKPFILTSRPGPGSIIFM
jgi:hypothetical protein